MSDVTSDYERIEKRTRIRGNIHNGIVYFFLCLWALIVLFPFYWMVLTSVKSYGSYNAEYIPKFFTLSPTLQNYVDAFTTVSLGRYLWNTLFFTVVTTAIMLVVITLAAFAFARLNFAGKDLIFTLFLSLMMIPNELVVITNFTTITNLDLRNTFTGLILPSVTSVFYIYLLRENFAQIPDELYLCGADRDSGRCRKWGKNREDHSIFLCDFQRIDPGTAEYGLYSEADRTGRWKIHF